MRGTRANTKGAALILALVLVTILTMLIGGALLYSQSHYTLAWTDSRSEASLHIAEAGVNDELQFIANHSGALDPTTMSSPPTVASGETKVSPFTGSVVKGRRGTVDGDPNGNFWVYSSMDTAGTTAWDGRTRDFYITATGYVYGAWRTVRVHAHGAGASVFSFNAVVALASYPNNSNAIGLQNATVTVNGSAMTNGQVSNSSSTFTATNCINANTIANSTGQFDTGNVALGGTLLTRKTPIVYPTVDGVLLNDFGKTWSQLKTSNSNGTGIYTYKNTASSTALNTTNCTPLAGSINNMLSNTGGGGFTNSWGQAGFKAGTAALIVSTTSGAGVSPITITTTKNHFLNTGDWVTITGVAGNTNANGTFQVTVNSGSGSNNTFTVPGTGNGNYSAGGQLIKDVIIGTVSNTTPITITTTANHNLNTGNVVVIRGTGVADGHWTVTVPNGNSGKTQFTLDGSTANGTYTNPQTPGAIGGYVAISPVQTLIFEPGDYYFTNVNVLADPFTELIIDPMAFASGGTPGQVRFWVNNPGQTNVQNDTICIPINSTKSASASRPDPALFRIYYGQDKGVLSLQRPTGYVNWDGSAAGDFVMYGAMYAVTKQPGDTSTLSGTGIDFVGQGGAISLVGALVADKVTFHYICNITYISPANVNDPPIGAGTVDGYTEGG